MHPGYLVGSLVTLCLGVALFLTPNMVRQLSNALNRSVGSLEDVVLKGRIVRYLFGLVLFGASLSLFRLGCPAP